MSPGEPTAPECVAVHFHPDWPFRGGTVIDSLARDGAYRSQFVTRTSNGGLTAFPSGDRWLWESRLFDRRYDDADAIERPVYGALDRGRYPHGPAARIGSAHLRLRAEVVGRSTFCFPDSTFQPDVVVAHDGLGPVLEAADAAAHDVLDDYVEAHVHGPLLLNRDVEALVLDPSFRGTPVEASVAATGCDARFGRLA